jgi:hypothetical protein
MSLGQSLEARRDVSEWINEMESAGRIRCRCDFSYGFEAGPVASCANLAAQRCDLGGGRIPADSDAANAHLGHRTIRNRERGAPDVPSGEP